MGGSSGGGGDNNTVRYAPYIEGKHNTFLGTSAAAGVVARETNPYDSYEDIDLDAAFFGAGYVIASFPSLYDMYGKFMAGLDVEVLWEQILEGTQNNAVVGGMVGTQSALLDDEIEETTLPRYQVGLRDINSVMSSSYLIGKSLIESAKVKSVAKFDAELRYKLIPIAQDRWSKHLSWNQTMISTYTTMVQLYYNSLLATDSQNQEFSVKESLWPFTVLDYEKANLGALQGAVSTGGAEGPSQTQKAIGGAMSGAALGASVGGPVGAAVGGVVGLAASFF